MRQAVETAWPMPLFVHGVIFAPSDWLLVLCTVFPFWVTTTTLDRSINCKYWHYRRSYSILYFRCNLVDDPMSRLVANFLITVYSCIVPSKPLQRHRHKADSVTVELIWISATYMHRTWSQFAWKTILVSSGETVAPPGEFNPKSPDLSKDCFALT